MKTVILGANGMLGADLRRVFYDWRPYLLDKDTLDVTNEKAVWDLFRNLKPELVINAAAYTDVDACEKNKKLARRVNGEAPGYLAEASKNVGAVFVHYSTDYVFGGDNASGYKEHDPPRPTSGRVEAGRPGKPINVYGESKLLGERAVQKAGDSYYIIRTSWLFGLNGSNFVETILRKVRGRLTPKTLKVVNDQHGKPTFSLDLARRTRELIEGNYASGIYHITNEPETTWYDFAKEIINQRYLTSRARSEPEQSKPEENTRFNTSIKSSIISKVVPCSSREFSRPAKRPQYSTLLNTKLPPSRDWREALGEYLENKKRF